MKTRWVIAVSTLVLAGVGWAQETGVAVGGMATGPGHPGKGAHVITYRREMGKWWQNPDVVSKVGLSDAQITQLDQVFYNHKMKLIDYGADMEKQDLKLQNLLDADQPDEGAGKRAGGSCAGGARQAGARVHGHEPRPPQAALAGAMAAVEDGARRRRHAKAITCSSSSRS